MVKVKRIGVLSLGKIFGIMYALIGLIAGAMVTLFSLALPSEAGVAGAMFGIGSIIFLPLFYGVIGFIGGIISAFLYNIIAGWVGGLEVETEQ